MTAETQAATTRRVVVSVLKRWYIVALAGLLGAVLAFTASALTAPVYHSSSTLFFALQSGNSGSDINQGSTYTQNQMLSFARLGMSSIVLGDVIEQLNLDMSEAELRHSMDITIPQNTVVLDVRVGSTDKEQAADIANGVAQRLAIVVSEIAPADVQGNPTVVAEVIEPAAPAEFQTTPNKQRDTLVGALAGALLAILTIALVTVLDTRVRSETTLATVTNRPLLGAISTYVAKSDTRPISLRSPNSVQAEQFRRIRSSLRFASASHDFTCVAVTSSISGEGKSTVSTNLAVTLAETGARVLLIDADLRRPTIATLLGLEPTVGLTTILVDKVAAGDVVHRWGRTSLDVLAAGEVPPNPAELLASTRMKDLLATLSERYDFIIVDTAPVLSVADATVIAQQADATILVVDASAVRRAQVSQSINALELAGAYVSGVVLNRIPAPKHQDPYFTEDDEVPSPKTTRRDTPASRRTRLPTRT
ncbi:polysaccharide biosynthesis tyrosine autokinase [Mycetocola sp. 2940]|uniref:polysaccharide biosynthesis tyrosine autokinase n=1 Tax=Mycetocola sp. 2940 TaxID=3156452 RepID=UPI00339A00DF